MKRTNRLGNDTKMTKHEFTLSHICNTQFRVYTLSEKNYETLCFYKAT